MKAIMPSYQRKGRRERILSYHSETRKEDRGKERRWGREKQWRDKGGEEMGMRGKGGRGKRGTVDVAE